MSPKPYQCPNCGAPQEVRPGDVAIKCRYCGTSFRTFEEENRFIVPVYYDSSRAIENFLLWVKKQIGYEESLPLNINLMEAKLHFYPFWVAMVRAKTSFTGVGEDAEYSGPEAGGGYRNIKIVMKQESGSFERLFEFCLPASKEIPPGGEMVAVSRARMFFSHEYVEQRGGILHGAVFSKDEARRMAEQTAANILSSLIAREVVRTVSRNDQIEVGDLSLVYVPVWKIVYEFRGKRYHALVDASSSRVVDASYPPDIVEKAGYLGVAALHVVAGVALAVLLWSMGWLPSLTALTGFFAAAAGYAWRGVSPTRAAEQMAERGTPAQQALSLASKWLNRR
ncbi:MAG: zinc ribbon domain-containing protein [Candidatus Caldarchaeum sp.]|nr:zinc ribbon domain-containing protein [Candidatus Caldarchaeum sp.]